MFLHRSIQYIGLIKLHTGISVKLNTISTTGNEKFIFNTTLQEPLDIFIFCYELAIIVIFLCSLVFIPNAASIM